MSGKTPGRITDITPTGSNIMIELLNEDEMMGTTLTLVSAKTTKPKDEARQAYILAVGPAVADNYGFKVGDRIILSGMGVPLPKFGSTDRDKVLVEPHSIKAVIRDSGILEVSE